MSADVTVSVAVAVAAGLIVSAETEQTPVQPDGTLACRLKVDGPQLLLSLFFSEIV